MRFMIHQVSGAFLVTALAAASSLAPGVRAQVPAGGPPANGSATAASENRRVIVLDPLLRFEELPDGSEPPNASYVAEGYAAALRAKASEALGARGCMVIDARGPSGATLPDASGSLGESLKQLQSQASKLARGVVGAAATDPLSQVAASCGDCLVLVQYVKGQVGPKGSWDPRTGAITSAMNTLLLQAALFSGNGGQVVWKNEVFLRSLPGASNKKFLAAEDLLFGNLKLK